MEAEHAWQATLGQLQLEMSKASFDTWVSNASFITYDEENGCFEIGVKNAYARDWLDDRLSAKISRILTGMMGKTIRTSFKVWTPTIMPERAAEKSASKSVSQAPSQTSSQKSSSINERYRFDNFVVGAHNRLAHAASQAVAESPARAYSTFYMEGWAGNPPLHAIGNACQPANLDILYISSEEFANDLINAIRTHCTPAFREKYRQTDVLLIDDIQFIAGSQREEFFTHLQHPARTKQTNRNFLRSPPKRW